ncbi:MAG: HpcH/HpaI aldolase/citrate lyase family protein [Sedimentitalea sp.]
MQTQINPFTAALRGGQKQLGVWVSLGSGFGAEVLRGSGFDWALLDMEHSPTEISAILNQLQVFADTKTTAIVRPPWNDSVLVKRLLDIGARGLLFPMVQNPDEARAAVAATRYPPRGIRGVSASTRATGFGRVTDYFQRIEDETTVVLQLESVAALDQATDIAAVDGVTGMFFGPADIGADMGLLGTPMHPDIWARIRPVARALAAKGVPVGTIVTNPDFAADLLANEFTFVAIASDTALLATGADRALAEMRKRLDPGSAS